VARVNWNQAFAEVVLILLGIGLAVGADSWRDELNARETERSYLTSLRSDLVTEDSLVLIDLATLDGQLRHNERLLSLLAGPRNSVPSDSIVGLLRTAFIFSRPTQPLPTYRVLSSSGDFDLIRSLELKRELARLESFRDLAARTADVAVEQWALDVASFFADHLNATAIYGQDSWIRAGPFEIEGYENNVLVARPELDPSWLWSQELANRIAIRNVTLDDYRRRARQSAESIARSLQLIDSILAR
jgi:hypothetical protein